MKTFITGVLVGAVLAAGIFWLFGDQIRGDVADTTEQLGRGVEKAGETIRESGKKLTNE